jgi:drug/metabolite transporter superfamily protein YnfA
MFSCILVIKEAKFCGSFYRRGGIYLGGNLLWSIVMDEANSSRLWGKIQGNSSPT